MEHRKFGVGQAIRRVEDVRFVTGAGRYTDDYEPENLSYAFVLRSPHAHARFRIGDLEAARAAPGVLLVLTHTDVAHLGDVPCLGTVQNADGSQMATPPYPVLAVDTVRHVGDAVAFIVAETEAQARDAAEAVEIEWEPLPAQVGVNEEGATGPLVWPDRAENLAFDTELGNAAETDAAFAEAARTVRLTLINNRVVTNYLEPRGCIGEYDGTRWTLTLSSQGSHEIRDNLARYIMKVPRERIRVVTPDVGGGFGTKLFVIREYALCAVAAERLRRPVKWRADRTEHFVGDAQGRDNVVTLEMALDPRGRFLGLRVDLKADLGAYLSQYAPFVPANGARMSPGCYRIPAVHARVRGYYTHTVPVDAYRGAGRPEAAYAIERFVDHIAREIGAEPAALRSLNFIPRDAMPYATPTGRNYEPAEFDGHMGRAMEVADWAGFGERLEESRGRGKLRGIGLASYIEACAGGSPEEVDVRLGCDGVVTVLIGTQSSGQGHATAYAQLVSQHLDIPPEQVRVVQGDTDAIATGHGTGGSRSIPVGGAAVAGASQKLADNLKQLASQALEAGIDDLELADGQVRIAGTDRAISLSDLAALPEATPELLVGSHSWTPAEATYPNGTHVCEVEIDPDTGETEVLRYVVVDDFGLTLNPLLLAGQVHGGVVQGIGQALHERTVYDADGQLLTASFMDYRLPRAGDIPDIHFETRNVPSTTNILGVKGAGEAGAVGSSPAVMNAVGDALHRALGIRHVDMPATPDRVFRAVREAQA